MRQMLIHGASNVLVPAGPDHDWKALDVFLSGDRIDRLVPSAKHEASQGGTCFDADGLLILPGIVDIHGDAFERQIQPRPEAVFSHTLALDDTDRQLVANGITTACHGVTYSWEGGLRGRDAAIALLQQVAGQGSRYHADHRIHLRYENHHVDGLRDALDWITQGWVHFLAFNDHLPSIARKAQQPEKLASYAERARCSGDSFRERIRVAQARAGEVEGVVHALAAACRRSAIPMASHDDETAADRLRYQEMEVGISEFPRTAEALDTALTLGNKVIMGAPNVLLGGSHCGGLAAVDAIRARRCHILASDYYYPSLLQAPFKLAFQEQACSLAQAWRLVSENPADALGLRDRGRIDAGSRADLLLVQATPSGEARLVATIAGGRLVYCAEPERLATHRLYPVAA